MKKLFYIFWIVFIFFYIYFPPVLNINIINILFLFSSLGIILEIKTVSNFILNQINRKIVIIFLLLLFYSFVIIILKSSNIKLLYADLLLIESLTISAYIVYVFWKNKIDKKMFLDMLLCVASIQSIISVLMMLIPSFQNAFIDLAISRGFDYEAINYFRNYRFYGFSSDLTFTMPIVQILVIYFYAKYGNLSSLKQKLIKIPFLITIFVSAIINARISLFLLIFILFIYAIYMLFFKKTSKKVKYKILLLLIISLSFISGLYVIDYFFPIKSVTWILTSINEVLGVFGINKSSISSINTFSYLFDDIRIPSGLNLIFGTGKDIFNSLDYRSDIGYLNNIWFGGIIYCFMLYYLISIFIINCLGNKKELLVEKTVLILSLLFVNIKGNIFSMNCFINLLILYLLFSKYNNHMN